MPEQLSLLDDSGRARRDLGISRALQHAEKVEPGWQDRALAFLLDYAETHETFSGESVRQASRGIVPEPPHLRAWGSVIMAGARRGWIRKIGYVQVTNPAAHQANAALWRSVIFMGI